MRVAIIQTRMGSSRFPGKVLREVCGKSLLQHQVERLKHACTLDQIVLATSDLEKDRPIVALAEQLGVGCYAGSELNLLDRIYQAAKSYSATTVVKIFGDAPLIDPTVVDHVLDFYLSSIDQYDGVWNVEPPSYPAGMDVVAFSFASIERAWHEVSDTFWKEWPTKYMFEYSESYRIGTVVHTPNLSAHRWVVDYEDDLIFVAEVYKRLYKEGQVFGMNDVLRLLEQEPQLKHLNQGHITNESWSKAYKERSNLRGTRSPRG